MRTRRCQTTIEPSHQSCYARVGIRIACVVRVAAYGLQQNPLSPSSTHRRSFVQTAAGFVSSAAVVVGQPSKNPNKNALAIEEETTDASYIVYHVIPDASKALNPSLETVDRTRFLKQISPPPGGALWLGEHHNSQQDHAIQVKLIRDLHKERSKIATKVAVGLEQIQLQFQPVLDEFVAGKCSVNELKHRVEWDKRWVWPFEVYEDVFVTCQELGIPLIALNVNSEDLALVEEGGLPALPRKTLSSYIAEPIGFADFASNSEFSTYVDYVIRPSYDLHRELGLLNTKLSGEQLDQPMSFRNFLSGRILWDEAMANRASAWTHANPGGLLLGLVGADHVKFGKGIPGRFARYDGNGRSSSISILLNPTMVDSRPQGSILSAQGATTTSQPDLIALQLRYLKDGVDGNSPDRVLPSSTGGVLPIADYLVVG